MQKAELHCTQIFQSHSSLVRVLLPIMLSHDFVLPRACSQMRWIQGQDLRQARLQICLSTTLESMTQVAPC